MLGLIDALKMPFWMRGADGRLKWVNRAYADAVEAEMPTPALRDGKEFLGTQARDSDRRAACAKPGLRADAVDRDRGRPPRVCGDRFRRHRTARPASPPT